MGTPEYTLPQALELFHHIGLDGAEIVVQDGYRCAIPQQADLDELNSLRRQADQARSSHHCLDPILFPF